MAKRRSIEQIVDDFISGDGPQAHFPVTGGASYSDGSGSGGGWRSRFSLFGGIGPLWYVGGGVVLALIAVVIAMSAAGGGDHHTAATLPGVTTPTPVVAVNTPTPSPAVTPSVTVSATVTPTPTSSPTATATRSSNPTSTPKPTQSSRPTSTSAPSPTPTHAPTPTPTPTSEPTPPPPACSPDIPNIAGVSDDGNGTLTLTGSCFSDVESADVYDSTASSGNGMDVYAGSFYVTSDTSMTVEYVAADVSSTDSCTVTVMGPDGPASYNYTPADVG